MHPRMIRRNINRHWRSVFGVIAAVLVFHLTLFSATRGHAETPLAADAAGVNVAYVHAEAQAGFTSQRVYAGRTVAGRAAEVGFKRGGEIQALFVDIGGTVKAGDVLAELDSRAIEARRQQAAADIALARANVEALSAQAQLARNTARRITDLHAKGHTSRQTLDETQLNLRARTAELNVAKANLARARAALRSVEVELSETRIQAPFAGVVQARHVDEGAQVGPGQIVLRLVENERTEAHIGIPADVGMQLSADDDYKVLWNDASHPATLSAVLPEIDPVTRTLTAVFNLTDSRIPLGSVVELTVSEAVATPGFWLPLTALTASDRGLWGVFVVAADNTLERRIVEIIHTEADQVYVRGTLQPEDRVVATGVQRVVPGQRVEPVAMRATKTRPAEKNSLALSYGR